MRPEKRHQFPVSPRSGILVLIGITVLAWSAFAQDAPDWKKLEKRLPQRVVVDPASSLFGYRFDTFGRAVQIPSEFRTGGEAAREAIRRAMAAGRVDSLVGLTVLTELGDHEAAGRLSDILVTGKRLRRFPPISAAAIPLVLRYHLPESEWPDVLIAALNNSPTAADSTIIICLTRFDFPTATEAYCHAFPRVDSLSQHQIVDRLTSHAASDSILWGLVRMSTFSTVQNMILDRLERMNSSHWPAQADSLAHCAVGDAACRVLGHVSRTDTSVYRPLMRNIIATAQEKDCVLSAALTLSAEGDRGAIPALKYRFYESDLDLRVVTGLSLCRLGETWGVGACIRLGLKHKKYRPEVIKALEKATGLAYGNDDEKWQKWLKTWKE